MLSVKKVQDTSGRISVFLSNELIRTVIDNKSGMVPELSFRYENGYVNTHWNPYFRGVGNPYNPEKHKDHWGGRFLYDIAGNFACLPGFGLPSEVDGFTIPQHGQTANELWDVDKYGTFEDKAVYSRSKLNIPDSIPISYIQYNILMKDQPVHYSIIKVKNNGTKDYAVNAAWHNTVGSPFLEKGCIIDLSADRFLTHPEGGEFDVTGNLALGKEFDNLEKTPLRDGGFSNLRTVPGMTGYTDFITGAIPHDSVLGWSSVINPSYGAAYLCFFKGPAAVSGDEIPLYFNDLWMQYGGRRYTPWAEQKDGTDLTFCLGTENTTGAFANGLAYSIQNPEILGNPTTIKIKQGEEKTLYYGTAAFPYQENRLSSGISSVEIKNGNLVLSEKTGKGKEILNADGTFDIIKKIINRIDS